MMMTTCTRTRTGSRRRWARRSLVAAGAAGALLLGAPGAAHAATGDWSGTLYPGAARVCVGASASYLATMQGYASGPARFVVLRNGVQIADSGPYPTSFAARYSAAGFYQFCVRNPQTATQPIFAQISIRTDADASPY